MSQRTLFGQETQGEPERPRGPRRAPNDLGSGAPVPRGAPAGPAVDLAVTVATPGAPPGRAYAVVPDEVSGSVGRPPRTDLDEAGTRGLAREERAADPRARSWLVFVVRVDSGAWTLLHREGPYVRGGPTHS